MHAFMYGNMGQSVPRCACGAWRTILHVSPYLPRTKDRTYLLFATMYDRLTDPRACLDPPCVYITYLCRRTGLLILLYVGSKDSNFVPPISALNALLMEPHLQEPRLQAS